MAGFPHRRDRQDRNSSCFGDDFRVFGAKQSGTAVITADAPFEVKEFVVCGRPSLYMLLLMAPSATSV